MASDVSNLLSRSGLRNPFTAATLAEINAIQTPPVASSDEHDPLKAPKKGAACWICLEGPGDGDGNNEEALRRDCACRGSGGYVHLTCFSTYAKNLSEEIWCGKRKAAPNADSLAFGRPWESCPNCKQFFSGKLRLDIAWEYARSTEGMVGGDRAFRHICARSWVTKSLTNKYRSCVAGNYEIIRKEYDELIDLIKTSLPIYEEGDRMNPVLMYIHATLQQVEGETVCNYSQVVSARLSTLNSLQNSSTISNEQRELYHKWDKLINSAIQLLDGLKFTMLGRDMEQLETYNLHVQTQYAHLSKQFSHLASSSDVTNSPKDEGGILKLSEELMHAHIEQKGESSTDGIKFALIHAQRLMMVTDLEYWRPFETLALLMKTLRTSLLSLGPLHDITDKLRYNLGRLISTNRQASNKWDPDHIQCPVIRYEEDCDIYIVSTENLKSRRRDIGEEMGWDPSDVILKHGALVVCVDLVKAQYLNGKRGWVDDYDEMSKRHLVHFEDKEMKSCLVKPGNLRLLFFEKEYEPTTSDDEAAKAVSKAVDDHDEEVDNDMPDLW